MLDEPHTTTDSAKPIDASLFEPSLLELRLPTQRVGYSDRTSWLMAVMSQIAYFEFEKSSDLPAVVDDLLKLAGREKQINHLRKVFAKLKEDTPDDPRKVLEEILAAGGFEMIDVFNTGGTQAFLARRTTDKDGEKMRVLAFRGTEKNWKDWQTDIRAKLVGARDEKKIGRIHQGFQDAYYLVEDRIEKKLAEVYADEPIYITGHSLGGALAVVATRFIDAKNLAACYTFGSPRVGDLDLARVFKTPIYRVVNASDAVPRVPFGYFWFWVMWAFDRVVYFLPGFPFLDDIRKKMEWIAGYMHYGDERYLTHVEAGASDEYPGLILISNPDFFLKLNRFVRRAVRTRLKSLAQDHSIGVYRSKLRALALLRNL